MCGIVGIVGSFSREKCLTIVNKMNGAIEHRGPDDEGVWAEDGFGFAMRRLSIIDLAGGGQPMWDDASGTGLVFNGEIYNYRALRAGINSKSQPGWVTESDTEVVLKTLASSGEEAINGWNGMFAVASWNKRTKELLLVRDRMGVKPLYYFWDGKTLLFASEIKAAFRFRADRTQDKPSGDLGLSYLSVRPGARVCVGRNQKAAARPPFEVPAGR